MCTDHNQCPEVARPVLLTDVLETAYFSLVYRSSLIAFSISVEGSVSLA